MRSDLCEIQLSAGFRSDLRRYWKKNMERGKEAMPV